MSLQARAATGIHLRGMVLRRPQRLRRHTLFFEPAHLRARFTNDPAMFLAYGLIGFVQPLNPLQLPWGKRKLLAKPEQGIVRPASSSGVVSYPKAGYTGGARENRDECDAQKSEFHGRSVLAAAMGVDTGKVSVHEFVAMPVLGKIAKLCPQPAG